MIILTSFTIVVHWNVLAQGNSDAAAVPRPINVEFEQVISR